MLLNRRSRFRQPPLGPLKLPLRFPRYPREGFQRDFLRGEADKRKMKSGNWSIEEGKWTLK